MDKSKAALQVAAANAKVLNAAVTFFQADMLDPEFRLNETFDIIVSNPPYVRNLEKKEISNNVKCHEPQDALFVPDDNALLFYAALTDFGHRHLHPGGHMYMEINQYLAKETAQLFVNKKYKDIELKKDIFGNYRMLLAKKG